MMGLEVLQGPEIQNLVLRGVKIPLSREYSKLCCVSEPILTMPSYSEASGLWEEEGSVQENSANMHDDCSKSFFLWCHIVHKDRPSLSQTAYLSIAV